jgi:hypothetical protein
MLAWYLHIICCNIRLALSLEISGSLGSMKSHGLQVKCFGNTMAHPMGAISWMVHGLEFGSVSGFGEEGNHSLALPGIWRYILKMQSEDATLSSFIRWLRIH